MASMKILKFQSGHRFFSLTPKEAAQYRANLFSTIHDIVFHGGGGYDWHTVYEMPMWLRKFTFKKIQEHFENQQQQNKKSNSPNTTNDINEARNILKAAAANNPTQRNPKSPQQSNIKRPDFTTSKAKASK